MPPDALEREQALEKARWIAARFKAHPTANYLYGTVMALEGDIADALQEEAATARARGLAEMDAGMEYRDRMIVFLSQQVEAQRAALMSAMPQPPCWACAGSGSVWAEGVSINCPHCNPTGRAGLA